MQTAGALRKRQQENKGKVGQQHTWRTCALARVRRHGAVNLRDQRRNGGVASHSKEWFRLIICVVVGALTVRGCCVATKAQDFSSLAKMSPVMFAESVAIRDSREYQNVFSPCVVISDGCSISNQFSAVRMLCRYKDLFRRIHAHDIRTVALDCAGLNRTSFVLRETRFSIIVPRNEHNAGVNLHVRSRRLTLVVQAERQLNWLADLKLAVRRSAG